jgi:hypothetical protein
MPEIEDDPDYRWSVDVEDYAEYPCKCGLPMSHEVGDDSVLVKHGADQRSVSPGAKGKYEAVAWIAGLHAEARQAEADAIGGTIASAKRKRKAKRDD